MNHHLPSTLPQFLERQATEIPEKEALFEKVDGAYVPMTYHTVFKSVTQLAIALQKRGVKKGDRVAILSNNCPNWVIADLATMTLGAITVPIYATLTAKEIAYILNDSGAVFCFVQAYDHIQKCRSIQQECDALKGLISFDAGLCSENEEPIKNLIDENPTDDCFETFKTCLDAEAELPASIVYTSGTTGNPKGVVLTHRNFVSNIEDILKALPLTSDDVVLSFLPLAHVFERTGGYYTVLAVGGTIYYAESIETVSQNLSEAKPTILVSVPRIYEKIHARILEQLSPIKRVIFGWAKSIGKKAKESTSNSWFVTFQYKLANKLVYQKIRSRIGGRIRFCVSGGAALSSDLCNFFNHLGLTIIEGYGMTESAPVISCNRLDQLNPGTVGLALDQVETKLAEDGELLVKGPNIMKGYWNLPDKTKEVLSEDGWLSTGDIATIDDSGVITIIDRKKELIVLSNGKNIPPQSIENTLTKSRYINQVMAIGENRNFLTALVMPNVELIKKLKQENKLSWNPELPLTQQPAVIELINQALEKHQKDLARYSQVKKVHLLEKEFTPETGELTPSLKLKRKIIAEKYASEIEALYNC